jgi:hypothetical protein
MKEIRKELEIYFSKKSIYFNIFSKVDSRIEGWFKGELLFLLENLIKTRKIKSYNRELNLLNFNDKRKNIDFEILLNSGKSILLELKSLTISKNAGTPRNLNFYFKEDPLGILNDFIKLDLIKYNGDKYVIGFIYPKPKLENWMDMQKVIIEKGFNWKCISNIKEFPDSHFIPVWKSTKKFKIQ